ncbi:peptidase domain-containing ABC transporter [Inconstantimicrobium mannanitabidum]|uniref:Peptidase C39 n=1 Tax=Inconstantimicrobium mannanitabidum TaxID=1604901 RepID=A0ACB5RIP8_9CLOT|nr:peptidase domain-containing ABC transporter [Clostridium sp. TW13]GKX68949.1 peptidase C39 [Clostridium sp. TW13]
MEIKHSKKVPYIEQMQQTECGLCCTAMILRYYKHYETLSELRNRLEAGRDGLKLSQIRNYFKVKGFQTFAYKTSVEGLAKVNLPAIVFFNNEHFVVLEKMTNSTAIVVDPAFGRRKMSQDELRENFTNIVLSVVPTEEFKPKKKQEKSWAGIMENLKHKKLLFTKIALISVLTYLISISIPVVVQYLIDEVALKNNSGMLMPYVAAILGIMALFAALTYIRGDNVIKLQVFLDNCLMGGTFKKLLSLPYKYFEVRSNGDLLFRLNSLHILRDLLSEQVIKGIMDFGAIVFILCYMVSRSIPLTVVTLILFALNGLAIIYMRPFMMEANQYEIVENSKLQTVQVETVYSILGVKTTGVEDQIFNSWNERYKKSIERYKYKSKILNIYTSMISVTQTVSPFLILFIGVQQYFSSHISLGTVIAYYSLSNTFFATGVSLFQTFNNFLLASSYLERIKDITDAKEEKSPENAKEIQLSGEIKLDNVSFAYTNTSPEVIKNVSLHIKKGQKVAIVGASGSGKSTLSKILLGLYEPTNGDIYYDDINFNELNKQNVRKQLGIVPQDISLFNKSIFENIKMNKDDITLEDVKKAAEIAQIAEEIEAMPMGYNTFVSDMGMNLSGGQRQRIALARAIINHPKLIILDEATSSLDTVNEVKVSNYFKNIGCTRIVIAHRLSTIIDSDVIYVMDKGQLVEAGTHKELMLRNGLYASLYKAKEEKEEKEVS